MGPDRERQPCPRPGCERQKAIYNFCCFADWRVLPKGLRKKINRPPTGETNQMQMVKAQRVWAELDPPPS